MPELWFGAFAASPVGTPGGWVSSVMNSYVPQVVKRELRSKSTDS